MFGLGASSRQSGVSDREEHCRSQFRTEERSQDLLRQWLSPDQTEQYNKGQRFEVVGSDTGTHYRIGRGTTMNIEELAADGRIARRWCFAPEGASGTGDVMLAQKIVLERFELGALAIANNDGPRGIRFPSRSFLCVDDLSWLVLAFACLATLIWSLIHIAFLL